MKPKDHHFIEVLEYLEPSGIGIYKDMSPLLQNMFPMQDKNDIKTLSAGTNKVKTLLNSLNDYIVLREEKAERLRFGLVGQGMGKPNLHIWLDEISINAHITAFGLEFLNNLRSQQLGASVSNSVIKTNEATELLYKRQNRLYYVTLAIAILSVLFPALSYFREIKVAALDKTVNMQTKELADSKAQLKRLQSSYDSLTLVIKSRKNSKKNN
jgi:hypothetical protein